MITGERDPSADVAFRLAGADDVPSVVELVQSAYRGETSRAGWTTEAHLLDGQRTDAAAVRDLLVRPDSYVILAVAAAVASDAPPTGPGPILGTCHLERVGPTTAYFGMFAVRPDLQAQGLGRSLLYRAASTAAGWGCSVLRMTVLDQRQDLIAWYGRLGFRPTGETEPFPYGDERFGRPRRNDLQFVVLEGPTTVPAAPAGAPDAAPA